MRICGPSAIAGTENLSDELEGDRLDADGGTSFSSSISFCSNFFNVPVSGSLVLPCLYRDLFFHLHLCH